MLEDVILSIETVVQSLGPVTFIVLTVFFTGIILRMNLVEALVSGLKAGIGFWGLITILDAATGTLVSITSALNTRLGASFEVADVGCAICDATGWAWPLTNFAFVFSVPLNIALFLLKVTKTVNIDMFNTWQHMYPAYFVYIITGNFIWAMIAFAIANILVLLSADYMASYVQEQYNLPGLTFTMAQATFISYIAIPFKWIFDRLPSLPEVSAEKLSERLGSLGDPSAVAFFIGLFLCAIAGLDAVSILSHSIVIVAIVILMPKAIGTLIDGFVPISDRTREYLIKKFPDREFYIGVESAFGTVDRDVMLVGVLSMPLSILLAFILPGNKMLPAGDIGFINFIAVGAMMYWKKDVLKSMIFMTFALSVMLYIGTYMAPFVTQSAVEMGIEIPAGVTYVSSLMFPGVYAVLGVFFARLLTGA